MAMLNAGFLRGIGMIGITDGSPPFRKGLGREHKKLTPKQERFIQEYLATSNASEAYRRAYNAEKMSPVVVNVKGCELGNLGHFVQHIASHPSSGWHSVGVRRQ